MTTFTISMLVTVCGASPLAGKPATSQPVMATQPAHVPVNKALSAEEDIAYKAELRAVSESCSLGAYREAVRQEKQATIRQAGQDRRSADEEARVRSQHRTNTTRENLYRRRPRKQVVLQRHFRVLDEIESQRRQDHHAAAGQEQRARQAAGAIERDLAKLEQTLRSFALAGVHGRYGQMERCASALRAGVSLVPDALAILGATDDSALCGEAGDGLEEAFAEAMAALQDAEPAASAIILTSQHAGLRKALSLPASRGMAVYVADVWEHVRDQADLSRSQTLAADFWLKEAEKIGKTHP